jgi:hypothetical protein
MDAIRNYPKAKYPKSTVRIHDFHLTTSTEEWVNDMLFYYFLIKKHWNAIARLVGRNQEKIFADLEMV